MFRTLLPPLAIAAAVAPPLIRRGHAESPPSATATAISGKSPCIDGRLDDLVWRGAPKFRNFVERKPRLGAKPVSPTAFSVLFDERALYVGVYCYDDKPELIRGRTRARDSTDLFRDDAISVKIDPAHDHRTTLGFAVSPAGARLDYRGVNEEEFRTEFDAVWSGAASRTRYGWSAEFRIPFAALGLAGGDLPDRIGLNLSRDHSRRNATYDWALLAPPLSPIAASRYGHLIGLRRGADPAATRSAARSSFALIPYLIGGVERSRNIADQLETDGTFDGGGDAQLNLGSRFHAQLTVNTDFAQVDLNDQVVNLTRFDLFLPEKRDFFLRGIELYTFGQEAAQLLYTRRIGLRDRAGSISEVPIVGGLKVVGRPTERLRIGVLEIVTRGDSEFDWESALVARGLFELGGGSHAGVMLTHRQSFETESDRNLAIGLDGTWRSASTPAYLQAFAMVSVTGAAAAPSALGVGGSGVGSAADMLQPAAGTIFWWRGRLIRSWFEYTYYDPDFRTDLGFLRRVGVHDMFLDLGLEPRIERYGVEKITLKALGGAVTTAADFDLLDWRVGGELGISSTAGFSLTSTVWRTSETVLAPFSVGRDSEIAAGRYDWTRLTVVATTPSVLPVSVTGEVEYGDFYDGTLTEVEATVTVRPTALVRWAVGGEHNRVQFDDVQRNFVSSIVNARLGLTLTRNLALDSYLAWNNLADLLRIQSRLRWSYLPGSDLFVVYQQDLDDDRGTVRFQSLLIKASYRLGYP